MVVEVRVTVYGRRGDHWAWTLYTWLLEVKDILEQEYGVKIRAELRELDVDLPVVTVNDEVAFIGVPGEEGYMIEELKKVFDEVIGKAWSPG